MDTHGAGRDATTDRRHRRRARWLVLAGFIIWFAGLGLWAISWFIGLGTALVGGAALTIGLEHLARGARRSSPPVWKISGPLAISLVLISQSVGFSDYGRRVTLVALGTLSMVLVFLRILDERLAIERQLVQYMLTDERRRLAGEVHDIVGHTLSASMLNTAAARLSVRSDPDATVASLERAEHHMRRSIGDIRSVVRLLRDDPGTSPPEPLAGELTELVSDFRAAGADIVLTVAGDVNDLPASSALTIYRVVQEGLTNAVRHGTGPILVTLQIDDAGVGVTIVNIVNDHRLRTGTTRPGSGLTGMRERAAALGGTLAAGDSEGNGQWALSVRIPS
jgi:signal transduction histidine kinase